jgi:hypothetical protein
MVARVSLPVMRRFRALVVAACLAAAACSPGEFFRQYEYEEELYLSLDGSATMYVNGSVVALAALRGAPLDAANSAQVDRVQVRDFFTTPFTHVVSTPTTSRRRGRWFVRVRIDVPDIRQLGRSTPFGWSTYAFERNDGLFTFRQTVGGPAHAAGGQHGADNHDAKAWWTGDEMVAFRLHVPSEIVYHNAGPSNPRRGNILVWEQPLAARLRGEPLTPGPHPALEARMKTESILYRTLWLFAASFGAVALTFAVALWWILRHGAANERHLSRKPYTS